ncbi:hypothetical protein ACFIJ5_18115 (plasmid) [Haloimpatiens sp. FM7330]|uniref:hypothetical protein n=1 Tax=Haloimpatiens sp. FM7330 TaxID=3298610 RepID=UPI003627AE98
MISKLSIFLIAIILLLLIKDIFIPMKKDKKIIAKGLYKTNILFMDSLILFIVPFSLACSNFYKTFHKSYEILYPKYISGFKDMFNYNKLVNIYNSLERSNVRGIYHIHAYIYGGISLALVAILIFLIFILCVKNNRKNRVYENIIYVHGIGYTLDNIKKFEWSEKKNKNRFGKIIEYYELTLNIKKKYKIFDDDVRNVIMRIKAEDKEKVNSVILKGYKPEE